jgi:transposase
MHTPTNRSSAPVKGDPIRGVEVQRLDFDPVALEVMRQVGLAQLIDQRAQAPKQAGPQHTLAASRGEPPPLDGPSVGQVVEAMVLNVLGGRVALYSMSQWLQSRPVSLYWGDQVQPEMFSDDRLARALDALWEAKPSALFSDIVLATLKRFHVDLARLHSDPSTVPLEGAYALDEDEPGPLPRGGFSKDNRRGGVQLVLGLTVQQDGIPALCDLYNGDVTDPAVFGDQLSKLQVLQRRLPDLSWSEVTFVGDSKACTQGTLGAIRHSKMHALTLLPRIFNAHATLLAEALKRPVASWPEIRRKKGRTLSDPDSVWRGVVLPVAMQLECTENGETRHWKEDWSALINHSSQLERMQFHTWQNRLAKNGEALRAKLRKLEKEPHRDKAVAEKELERLQKEASHSEGWLIRGEVRAEGKRWWVRAEVDADPEERQRIQRELGTSILVTSRKVGSDYPASRMLEEYREQFVPEQGFRWLKGPNQIAPVLLKTPTRIAALGLIFAIALMLHRLMQHVIRRNLHERKQYFEGHHRKPTQKPTLALVMARFSGLHLVHLLVGNAQQTLVSGATGLQRELLSLLDLPPDLYDRLSAASARAKPPQTPS